MSKKSNHPGPPTEGQGTVSVRCVPEQVRIDLLDHRFQRVASAYGSLRARVPVGLYQLVFDTGLNVTREFVSVEPGPEEVTPRAVKVPFPSAAPIPGTLDYSDAHAQAAAECSRFPRQHSSGGLMVFARVAGEARPSLEELRLLDSRGDDVSKGWKKSAACHRAGGTGWVGWSAALPPGGYLLRWGARTATEKKLAKAVDQSLWVTDGWVTSVFVVARESGKGGPALDRDSMTIHQGRADAGFDPFDENARANQFAMELALASWRSRQRILGDDPASLDVMLDERYVNPLLGVLAAHSLWQQAEPNYALLERLHRELASLLPGHPDLLALQATAYRKGLPGVPAPEGPLDWPPMFEASMRCALRADWRSDALLAPGGLATRAAPNLLRGAFWTRWLHGREPCRATAPPADVDKAALLGYWLCDSLSATPLANSLPNGAELEQPQAGDFWGRFAASDDPVLYPLARQLDWFYDSRHRNDLDLLRTLSLADVAESLSLPRLGLLLALARWLAHHQTSATPSTTWPPSDGQAYLRGEAFGRHLVELVEALARRSPRQDYTDAAAHVYLWLDAKLKKNRRFVNAKRFPSERHFRAYIRRAALNAARMAARRQRHHEPLSDDMADSDLSLDPAQAADLRERRDALPPKLRAVYDRLFSGDEDDFDVVASLMNLTPRQLARLVEQAVDAMRKPPAK